MPFTVWIDAKTGAFFAGQSNAWWAVLTAFLTVIIIAMLPPRPRFIEH